MTDSATGYHDLKEQKDKGYWKKEEADYHHDDKLGEVLVIDGHPVMEEWEKPYMRALAKVAGSKGGKVLEVGFGLGLSASCIQEQDIEEHLIIEANEGVVKRGKEWAKDKPHKVTFLEGMWQDVVAGLEDNSLDGVLYDTYPNTKEEQHIHQFGFIKEIYPKLKPGGILTYCNLTSIGVLKGEHKEWKTLWNKTQVPHIRTCGFTDYKFETSPVTPPEECKYYAGHKEALVPKLFKRALKKPKFITVDKINPNSKGINLVAKVAKEPVTKKEEDGVKIVDCVVGDASGSVTCTARGDAQVAFFKLGQTIIIRNAHTRMLRADAGKSATIRVEVDKWGKIEVSKDALADEVNTKTDVSATEYELR